MSYVPQSLDVMQTGTPLKLNWHKQNCLEHNLILMTYLFFFDLNSNLLQRIQSKYWGNFVS